MTMPNERLRAVVQTRSFLLNLLDPKKTPKVPKTIRQDALYLLRHFPQDYEMEIISQKIPEYFDKS